MHTLRVGSLGVLTQSQHLGEGPEGRKARESEWPGETRNNNLAPEILLVRQIDGVPPHSVSAAKLVIRASREPGGALLEIN